MSQKKRFVFATAIMPFLLLLVSVFPGFSENSKAHSETKIETKEINKQITIDVPTSLEIPAISVSAAVKKVGVSQNGSMGVPSSGKELGWFGLSPRPGDLGDSIVTGHSGFRSSSAVFDDLHKLKIGDEITVTDKSGDKFVFVVQEFWLYDPKTRVEQIFTQKTKRRLILITCAGDWNDFTQSSTKRLLVFAEILDRKEFD